MEGVSREKRVILCYTLCMKRLVLLALVLHTSLGFLSSQELVVPPQEETLPMSFAVTASSCIEHSQHGHEHIALETEKPCTDGEQCILQVEIPFVERTAFAEETPQVARNIVPSEEQNPMKEELTIRTIFVSPSPHHSVVLRV